MREPQAHTLLLGAVFTAAIWISVVVRRDASRRLSRFVWFSGTLALWYALQTAHAWHPDPLWQRAADLVLVLLPQAAIRFFHAFQEERGEPRRSRFVSFGTALGVVMAGIGVSPWWNEPFAGWLRFAYCTGLLLGAAAFLYLRAHTVESRVDSARIQILVLGGALALAFSLLDYLPAVGVEFPPAGPVVTPVYIYTLAQSLLRHRLFDVYELLGRFAVLTALALSLAAIFHVLVLWAAGSRYFFVNALSAAFVILIVFDPLRSMVEQKIGEVLLRERAGFETRALALRRRLGRMLSLDEIGQAVAGELEESRRFTHGALYLLTADGLSLVRRAHFGPEPAAEMEVAAARPLLDLLAGDEPVRRGSLVRQRERYAAEGDLRHVEQLDLVRGLLEELRADLVLPIRGESRMLGLLGVGNEGMPEGPNEDDAKTLGAVAVQMAIAVENIEVYRRMKTRDRMAVVGEMAAGLAHEIRNPLGAIKAAAQILGEPGAERNEELLRVLVEESDRLNGVLSDFLEYARSKPAGVARAELHRVLRRCAQILHTDFGDALEVELGELEHLPPVPVDPDRLLQVFLNLGVNAAQAMNGRGKLEIAATVRRDSGSPNAGTRPTSPTGLPVRVLVRFRDHGPGIPAEVFPRIFIPFFTTKERGTGLGLAISQRIVEEAGGMVEVRSEPGRGADFTVVLPALEPDGGPAA